MSETIKIEPFDYLRLLAQVRRRVQLAQQRAVYSANDELLRMYWDIGHLLSDAQKQIGWGNGALKRLSVDMRNDYPEIKGFSVRNCQCMIQFYNEYNQELTLPKDGKPITQLPVAQLDKPNTQLSVAQLPKYNFTLPVTHLPWTHNIILIQRVKDIKARYWYMVQSITNHWSKDYLADAIKQDDYKRHGALANNFDMALPQPEAEEVKSILKDPYLFDMLTFKDKFDERDIELGSDYELGNLLPKDLRSSLPSIEEIERDLSEE